jgi:chromate transporter
VLGFYFVGCFIIGPIDTIFAYFLALVLQQQSIDAMQLWIGIPIAFLLPGSLLNIGIYFGSIIDGVRGGLLSAIFLYIPCFLSIFGLLPQWKYYRDKQGIQRLYQGMVCVTTGLSLSMVTIDEFR